MISKNKYIDEENNLKYNFGHILKEEENEESFEMPEKDSSSDANDTENTDNTEQEVVQDDQESAEIIDDQVSSSDIEFLKTQVSSLTKQINLLKNSMDNAISNEEKENIETYISSQVKENISYINKSLKEFFIFEEKNSDLENSIEDLEKNIESLDDMVSQGTDLVKSIKDKEVNVKSYVDAAIKAYRHFDNLFSKDLIVKQATRNVLVLNSGKNIEDNIKEFDELFHKELYKKFGIEYPEHILNTKKYNTAIGATKQG